ncbi:MAG: hypothetical protein Q4D27_08145, partial [Coriobacteriia bacterium]|nr:hypothetical protein [Coriobacteriia bacterium]
MSGFCARVNAYFELPLLGEPGFDVHCSVNDATRHAPAPSGGDPAWLAALSWFDGVADIEAVGGDVLVMAEVDAGADPASRPGMYLIQHDRAD